MRTLYKFTDIIIYYYLLDIANVGYRYILNFVYWWVMQEVAFNITFGASPPSSRL